ncbi:hypothetical protein ACN47E_002832 [Coniothyrium glycines]
MAGLESLSDDILYMIVCQVLYPQQTFILRHLRLVSQRLKSFADTELFRELVLVDDEDHELTTFRLVERLADPEDSLRRHVRALQIKAFKGDEHSFCMNTSLLDSCLRSIIRLESFSWDSDVQVPSTLLQSLRHDLPCARIYASLRNLDHNILRLPNLYRLDISIHHSETPLDLSRQRWKQLRNLILSSRNLRILSIDTHLETVTKPHQYPSLKDTQLNPLLESSGQSSYIYNKFIQLPLEIGDMIPPLEDFQIRAKRYNLDIKHCSRLLKCMDWTKLKRLRIETTYPDIFFRLFQGRLSQLKTLDFACFNHDQLRRETQEPEALYLECSYFIQGIDNLEELTVRCDVLDVRYSFWSCLIGAQWRPLKHLSILPRLDDSDSPMWVGNFGSVLSSLQNLVTLNVDMEPSVSDPGRCSCRTQRTHALSTEYIGRLPIMSSLQELAITIKVQPCVERSLESYISEHAHCVIRTLWATYANAYEKCALQMFRLTFWRWEPTTLRYTDLSSDRRSHVSKIVFESIILDDNRVAVKTCGTKQIKSSLYHPMSEVTNDGPRIYYVSSDGVGKAQETARFPRKIAELIREFMS